MWESTPQKTSKSTLNQCYFQSQNCDCGSWSEHWRCFLFDSEKTLELNLKSFLTLHGRILIMFLSALETFSRSVNSLKWPESSVSHFEYKSSEPEWLHFFLSWCFPSLSFCGQSVYSVLMLVGFICCFLLPLQTCLLVQFGHVLYTDIVSIWKCQTNTIRNIARHVLQFVFQSEICPVLGFQWHM